MTLTNPKPLGYAYGELLTSVQMNSVTSQLPNAVDGIQGGAYALVNPLSITGDTVTFSTITVPNVAGNTTFSADVTVADDLFVQDNIFVTNDVEVGDDLEVGGNALMAGTLGVTGTVTAAGNVLAAAHIGPLTSTDTVRALKNLRLSVGTGWDSAHSVTVGTEPQLILADALTTGRIYTISDIGAGDGDFFLFFNKSPGGALTVNAPIGTILTITNGNAGLAWRSGGVWYGQVISAT